MFDPYGSGTVMNASWVSIGSTAFDWSIGFQGLIADKDTSLIYARYRCLHNTLGRFLQRDVSDYFANLFEFADSTPINKVDPLGLDAAPCSLARMDELRAVYVRARTQYYPGEPNPYQNLSIDQVIAASEQAFWEECDAAKRAENDAYQLGFDAQVAIQWDCYTDCMKKVAGWAAALGATAFSLDFPASKLGAVGQLYTRMVGEWGGTWALTGAFGGDGTLRTAIAGRVASWGWTGTYNSLMRVRGLALRRAGYSRVWSFGGRAAANGIVGAVALASIACSAKCTYDYCSSE